MVATCRSEKEVCENLQDQLGRQELVDRNCIVPGRVECINVGYTPGVVLYLHLARIQHVHLGFVPFGQKSVSANLGGYVVMM